MLEEVVVLDGEHRRHDRQRDVVERHHLPVLTAMESGKDRLPVGSDDDRPLGERRQVDADGIGMMGVEGGLDLRDEGRHRHRGEHRGGGDDGDESRPYGHAGDVPARSTR